MTRSYVIVGASLDGATAVITLREEGADGDVTLIDAEAEPPHEGGSPEPQGTWGTADACLPPSRMSFGGLATCQSGSIS